MSSPFAFRDRVLEHRFQDYLVSSCADRIKPMVCAFFPVLFIIRLSSLAYSILYGSGEIIVPAIRLSAIILLVVLISKNWNPASNYGRGLAILWTTRFITILGLQQLLVAKSAELQAMATHVGFVCAGGWMINSFSEFFLFALMHSFLRPLLQLGLGITKNESIFDVIYQNTMILALGVSIAWTVQANQRRDWLRSRTNVDEVMHPRRPKPSKLANSKAIAKMAASSTAERGVEDFELEDLSECCLLSAVDVAEMREQALQVRAIKAI